MKILRLVCLMMILAASLRAADFGLKIKDSPDLDGWSITHLGSGFGCYYAFKLMGINEKGALALTIATGYLYEIVKDGYGNNIPFTGPVDKDGADFYADPLWTGLGGAIACIVDILFQIHCRIEKNKIQLSISLR